MITLFNYWHYIAFAIGISVLIAGVAYAFIQKEKKIIFSIIFSVLILTILMSGISIAVIDKYTKTAKLYKLDNKRNLSTEKIMYTGIVKNEGKFEIGEVIFEIKLVNKGHVSGNVKAGTFYNPSGFFEFFSGGGGFDSKNKPQQVIHEFVVAKNLKPGESQDFRVYFDYPPYFVGVTQYTKLYAH